MKPETVVGWHRAGFRLYWRWRSKPCGGRPGITGEIRTLIRRMADENPDWGAPKIHGAFQKLGFVVSERSAARYLRRVGRRGEKPGCPQCPQQPEVERRTIHGPDTFGLQLDSKQVTRQRELPVSI